MILALYCPDIAQNAGTTIRTGACLGVPVHIIEPAGFPVGAAAFRRAGMDYLDAGGFARHASFEAFDAVRRAEGRRLVLFTTAGETAFTDFAFAPSDALLFGRELQGVPLAVHRLAEARVTIPMKAGLRSLNVAVSAAMGLGEALRQTGGFPSPAPGR